MKRHVIDPRPDWQRIVEEQGLVYPLTRYPDDSLRPYWDESAYYSFSLAEVEALESSTRATRTCSRPASTAPVTWPATSPSRCWAARARAS